MPSINYCPHDFDAQPHWIELVTLAFAEMVVVVAALLVVEADPELFLVLAELDLERLARRQGLVRPPTFDLEEDRVGMFRIGGQRQHCRISGGQCGVDSYRPVDMNARLIAIAT